MPANDDRPALPRWRSYAFGLDLEGSLPVPGLPPDHGPGRGRATRLELASAAEIDALWPLQGVTRLLEERSGEDRDATHTIDHHDAVGDRLYARGFGLALIAADGEQVRYAPPHGAESGWQRFVVGRVLPWTATVRGLEVFHASAVAIDGRAIALVGPSGVGKTSLAVRLALRGADFLTDDALALERPVNGGGKLRAHPGAALAGLRADEREALAREWPEMGRAIAPDDKTFVALARAQAAVPLGAVYLLTRGDQTGSELIEPLAAPDPGVLLASTFVLGVQTPRRLKNQLDVCAEVACSVPVFHVRVRPSVGSAALAEALHAHARAALRMSRDDLGGGRVGHVRVGPGAAGAEI